MDPPPARSTGVTAALVDAAPPRALDFDALYRDARDDVYAYAATLLRDRAAAEDVAAAAFERAYRRQGRYDARKGSPRAWLFGIARNAALDELRRRKRVAAAHLPIPSPEPDPAALVAVGDAAPAPASGRGRRCGDRRVRRDHRDRGVGGPRQRQRGQRQLELVGLREIVSARERRARVRRRLRRLRRGLRG